MSKKIIGKLAGVALSLAGLASTLPAQVTHYVRPENPDGAPPFTNWVTAATNIIEAVAVANANNAGDTVLISNGVYALTNNVIIQNSIVRGVSGDRTAVTVDGLELTRCFQLTHANAVLSDLTVSNGVFNPGNGGGAYMTGGTITNCIFSNGGANRGAGVYLNSGLMTDCLVVSNTAGNEGGGVYIIGSSAVLRGSTILGNTAYYSGGGVFATNCLVTNCLVAGNGTIYNNGNYGAGGAALGGLAKLANCVISNNWAPSSARGAGMTMLGNATASWCHVVGNTNANTGGGIFLRSEYNLVEHCVVAANVASTIGGGIYVIGGTNHLIRGCTIQGNTSLAHGGGIYAQVDCTISNCLVTGNRGGYGAGIYTAIGTNMLVTHSTISSNMAFGTAYGGGGMWVMDGGTVSHCVIRDNQTTNTASYGGGGIYLYNVSWPSGSNTTILRNCLIAGNVADGTSGGHGQGGGLFVYNSPRAQVQNCTIAGNDGYIGGGINCQNGGMIENTIVFDNTASMVNSNWYVTGSTTFTNCCAAPISAAFNAASTDLPPGYDANYRLLRGSPCVNAGLYRNWMDHAADLDGRLRLDRLTGLVDMGAYEYVFSGTMFNVR